MNMNQEKGNYLLDIPFFLQFVHFYSQLMYDYMYSNARIIRLKKNVSSCSESPLKTGKEHKDVVHAAGDVGISGDGYRWRKYGQKMVKGNPHPR